MKRRNFITATALGMFMGNQKVRGSVESQKELRESISEPARRVPIVSEAEVVVCGGGPAGIAAALASARSGARTALVESENCLGGVWTAGALCLLLDQYGKGGIMKEILEKLNEMRALRGGVYDVESMKFLLDDLCSNSGMEILLHTKLVAGIVQDRRINAIITESKSGREAITGKVFIDCTGDGDLAALTGCGYDFGRHEDGSFQPMSLMALLTGIGPEAMRFTDHNVLLKELEKAGLTPSYRRPSLWYLNGVIWGLMATHLYGYKGTDARDLTKATMIARKEIHQLVEALRSRGGIWKDLTLAATGQHIGVREGRRIHGRYTVSEQDVLEGKRHSDAVCRVTYPIDIHRSQPPKKGEGALARFVKSKPYDIPMRALIAKDLDNLFMAGRCISGDFTAHASYRVTGNAVAMGEAAGKKAAEIVKKSE